MRWVKVCDKRRCHERKDEGFEKEHGENTLTRPERGFLTI
jgi:hypothetical protein